MIFDYETCFLYLKIILKRLNIFNQIVSEIDPWYVGGGNRHFLLLKWKIVPNKPLF